LARREQFNRKAQAYLMGVTVATSFAVGILGIYVRAGAGGVPLALKLILLGAVISLVMSAVSALRVIAPSEAFDLYLQARHIVPEDEKEGLARLSAAVISAVNFAEVVSRLAHTGDDLSQVLPDLHNLIRDIRPFDVAQAEAADALAPLARTHGLSLGDRACLVLGKSLNVPVLTADQSWSKLSVGVTVELIRTTPSH
jgi:PIN domain nuclease of toxin-antitoxin system